MVVATEVAVAVGKFSRGLRSRVSPGRGCTAGPEYRAGSQGWAGTQGWTRPGRRGAASRESLS